MASSDVVADSSSAAQPRTAIVNDFSIQVATVNGSGSQTANIVLLRAIFQMGIPGVGQEPLPVEHRGPADLVHHPRQQATATSRARRKSTSWSR